MSVSAVYVGTVRHAREVDPPWGLTLPFWTLLLDLDELASRRRSPSLFGGNRARLLSWRDADHFRGRRADTARARLARVLLAAGLAPATGPVQVLAQPRFLGLGFNPVSFWWCHDAHGALHAAVAEVHNTFGDRHAYVLPAGEAERVPEGLAWTVKKRMHVSPFFDLEGSYRFVLSPPGERLHARADLVRGGVPRLRGWFDGERRPLADRTLVPLLLRHPAMPWRAWAAIHRHAWRLWRAGAIFRSRPPYHPASAGRLPP